MLRGRANRHAPIKTISAPSPLRVEEPIVYSLVGDGFYAFLELVDGTE